MLLYLFAGKSVRAGVQQAPPNLGTGGRKLPVASVVLGISMEMALRAKKKLSTCTKCFVVMMKRVEVSTF